MNTLPTEKSEKLNSVLCKAYDPEIVQSFAQGYCGWVFSNFNLTRRY